MPGTFDDVALQMAFSERSSRMRTGVVDGVEGSFDIKEGNPVVATVTNSDMAIILLPGRVANGTATFTDPSVT